MAAFFNDTFTEASKTAITSHTSDSGHTWSLFAGATPVPDVYSTLGGVVGSGSTSGQAVRASVIAPNADVTVTATVLVGSQTGNSFGIIARANSGGTAAYLAAHLPATDQWGIYRVGSSLATTQLGSLSGTINYANNATPSVEFIVTGSGATVSLEIKVDGSSVLTATDTDAARITTAGYVGLWFSSGAGGVATGWLFNTLSADDVVSASATSLVLPRAGMAHRSLITF